MTTKTQPITSEAVAAWMKEQLANFHGHARFAHITVSVSGYASTPKKVEFNFGDAEYPNVHGSSFEECLEKYLLPRQSKADLKREAAAKLLKEADELEATTL